MVVGCHGLAKMGRHLTTRPDTRRLGTRRVHSHFRHNLLEFGFSVVHRFDSRYRALRASSRIRSGKPSLFRRSGVTPIERGSPTTTMSPLLFALCLGATSCRPEVAPSSNSS